MKQPSLTALAAAVALASTLPAGAAIESLGGGTGAPAATLGPFLMTPFPLDAQPLDIEVGGVPSPLGGDVGFSVDLFHTVVGVGWDSWSHGYTGDVYYDLSGAGLLTLDLPAGTLAFYFYAQPEELVPFEITAEIPGGTLLTQLVDGDSGASYFGFFATGGDTLTSVTVSSDGPFGIGEFGIANFLIPEGSTLAGVLGLGVVLVLSQRLRGRRTR